MVVTAPVLASTAKSAEPVREYVGVEVLVNEAVRVTTLEPIWMLSGRVMARMEPGKHGHEVQDGSHDVARSVTLNSVALSQCCVQ